MELLTPRQQEVATLLAEGLTNREIADRLYISERTAEGHVEQIRQKLGVRSRTQIATWILAQRGDVAPDSSAQPAVLDAPPPQARSRRLPRRAAIGGLLVLAIVAAAVVVASTGGSTPTPVLATVPVPAGAIERPVAAVVHGDIYTIVEQRILRIALTGRVTPFAGGSEPGFGGDGGPATQAKFADPKAIVFDATGAAYVADAGNNRIRMISSDGIVTTIAGTGARAFGGDGGPATDAQLDEPSGLAVGFGSIFVADSGNNRVRRIRDGLITTVAGTGDPGYAGDGSAATSALLDTPEGLAIDHEGSLFVADSVNDRVREVDTSGVITTIAGNGTRGFSGDGGQARDAELDLAAGPLNGSGGALAVDDEGDLFIADGLNNRVRVVDVSGVITTVAGTGASATAAGTRGAGGGVLALPLAVSVGSGTLLIADTGANELRVLQTAPLHLERLAGGRDREGEESRGEGALVLDL